MIANIASAASHQRLARRVRGAARGAFSGACSGAAFMPIL